MPFWQLANDMMMTVLQTNAHASNVIALMLPKKLLNTNRVVDDSQGGHYYVQPSQFNEDQHLQQSLHKNAH